ncbi:MAG: hypothetical protein Ct9H300mP7_5720 [Verrucomicrobiota bacterium]|nr:MAG: hypothetical protein Ct9H300mP7_5720 [Verrucomicrobiota bacterium]
MPKNLQGNGLKRSAIEAANVPDNAYIDGIVCDAALSALAELKAHPKPFFLAVGYRKPHLPFCAPQKYWNLYDRAKISRCRFLLNTQKGRQNWRYEVGWSWKATAIFPKTGSFQGQGA